MNTLDVVTLVGVIVGVILGLYGAVLSTILAIRERQKDKRRVIVILEQVAFAGRLQLSIINGGFRPVTITSVSMTLRGEDIPNGGIAVPSLPQTIGDGEQILLEIDKVDYQYWLENNKDLQVKVFDAEGNMYIPSHIRTLNDKWGGYLEQINNDER